MLSNLAEMVVRELEKEVLLEEQRQRSEMLSQENTQLLRAIDAFRCVRAGVKGQGWGEEVRLGCLVC